MKTTFYTKVSDKVHSLCKDYIYNKRLCVICLHFFLFAIYSSGIYAQTDCNEIDDVVLFEEAILGDIETEYIDLPLPIDPSVFYVINGSLTPDDLDTYVITVPVGTTITPLNINNRQVIGGTCANGISVSVVQLFSPFSTNNYPAYEMGDLTGASFLNTPLTPGTWSITLGHNIDSDGCTITCYRMAFSVTCPADPQPIAECTTDLVVVFAANLPFDLTDVDVMPPGYTFSGTNVVNNMITEDAEAGDLYQISYRGGCDQRCQFNAYIVDIDIEEQACNCMDPQNIQLPGQSLERFHRQLIIEAVGLINPFITTVSNVDEFMDENGDPVSPLPFDMSPFEDIDFPGPGVRYVFDFWMNPGATLTIGVTLESDLDDAFTQEFMFSFSACTEECPLIPVPTIGVWALVILTILISIIGIIWIKNSYTVRWV